MVVANSQHATSCLVCLSQTDGVMPCKDRVAGSPAAAVATAPARRRGRVVKVMASGLVHGFCGVNTRLAVGVGGMRAAQPAFRKNNNEKPIVPAALSHQLMLTSTAYLPTYYSCSTGTTYMLLLLVVPTAVLQRTVQYNQLRSTACIFRCTAPDLRSVPCLFCACLFCLIDCHFTVPSKSGNHVYYE